MKIWSLILTFVFVMGQLFTGWPQTLNWLQVQKAHAAVGDIGHWQDSAGSQVPGTSFAAFAFASQQRNDGIYTKPDGNTIELDEAGDYLIIATMHYTDSSNGRFGPQARIALTSGTGTLFTSHYTGFSRDNSENETWVRAVGVVIGASTNAQVEVQTRRDSDAPTGGSVANTSDVQVVRIDQTNYGLYAIGGTSGALGGTTPNTVDITAASAESDTAAIEGNTSTETVTVKGDNKRYLVAWSVSGDTAASRTQRIGHLEYDGTDDLATQAYFYQRNGTNEFAGLGSMDIVETSTADIDIQIEVYRGPGVSADQGGADNDGSWDVDGLGQMIVLELPDSAEVFRSHDQTGLQDITSAATLNAMRTVDFNDSASFTQASSTAMDVTAAADVFTWANIWTARNNVGSGSRLTAYGSITVNSVEQTVGIHGSYSRGAQSTTDTFGMGFNPAGIYAVGTAGHDIGVNTDPLSGTEGGGTDRTQAGSVGFFALNLDTLAAAGGTLGVAAVTDVTLTSAQPGDTGDTTFGVSELITVTDGGSGWSLTVVVQTTFSDGGSNTIPDANVYIRKDGVVTGGSDVYTIWSGTTTNVSESDETVALNTSQGVGTRSSGTGGDETSVRPSIQMIIPVGQTPTDYDGVIRFTVV